MIIAKEFEGQLWVRAADHQAENAALRADAERYRWLREACETKEDWWVRISTLGQYRFALKLDTAIDNAMKKENGK